MDSQILMANKIEKQIRRLLRRLRQRIFSIAGHDQNAFLWRCRGVIHVGANVGHEAHEYSDHGLKVLWIEPIPEIFKILLERIAEFPGQTAIQALITDQKEREYEFHVASNNGASSSIFQLGEHRDIWPEVQMVKTEKLQSTTLPCLLEKHCIEKTKYDCLVLDTQGSELLILKGAHQILQLFKYIKTEAADFDAYVMGAKLQEISSFLKTYGFFEVSRQEIASHKAGGKYFDVLFKRQKTA